MKKRIASKIIFVSMLVFLSMAAAAPSLFAKEVKVVFTGQAYSSLYPCSCFPESDGGVARRATLLKTLRVASKDVVVVEAGSSFASGKNDSYSQDYEKDKLRTEFYLKSLEKMNYDALLVSSQEYVFGADFLGGYKNLPFISSNIKGFVKPYVIKNLGWVKIGILGITDSYVIAKGIRGWQAPDMVLKEEIAELKKKGADIVILLSSLNPMEEQSYLKDIKGIDVIVNGSQFFGSVELKKENGLLYVGTWREAKKVGILTLDISGSKITKSALESRRLSDELADDKAISSIVPQCFQSRDCKRQPGFFAKCENGMTKEARCLYQEIPEVKLTVIVPRKCATCQPQTVVENLNKTFKFIGLKRLFEDEPQAKKMLKEFDVKMLPAYFFDKDIEKLDNFSLLSSLLDKGREFYRLKPFASGVSYFIDRTIIPNRLDVFFDFEYKFLPDLFMALKIFTNERKDIDLRIHFIATKGQDGKIVSRGGPWELEEFYRIACIDSLYRDGLFDYIICRAQNPGSSWWDDCIQYSEMDAQKIKQCVTSGKGEELVLDRIKLTQELEIANGPVFLINNKEIFGVANPPTREEFARLFPKEDKEGQKKKVENTER